MAALAIGAIGAAVASALPGAAAFSLFGMSAAQLGWLAGSMLGSTLFAPDAPHLRQEGPRLSDLKVIASTYGKPIPRVYGSIRISGNIIWAAAIVETAHESTQGGGGGKGGGGGGGSVTTTSYTYSQSFAVALCEGEIAGIRKIWANGKLIYNLAADASLASMAASNARLQGIRVYTGTESQTANSTIAANVGAANCPAYRGTAYVVFSNLQLAEYGNRAPNLEFEVVTAATVADLATESSALPVSAAWKRAAYRPGMWIIATEANGGTGKLAWSSDGVTWLSMTSPLPATTYQIIHGAGVFWAATSDGIWYSSDGLVWYASAVTGETIYSIAYDPVTGDLWAPRVGASEVYRSADGVTWAAEVLPGEVASYQPTCCVARAERVVIGTYDAGAYAYARVGGEWRRTDLVSPGYGQLQVINGAGTWLAYDAGGSIWTSIDAQTWTLAAGTTTGGNTRQGAYGDGAFFLAYEGRIATTTDGSSATTHDEHNMGFTYYSTDAVFAWHQCAVAIAGDDRMLRVLPVSQMTTVTAAPLSDVVEDICTRCPPLTAADVDVTDLAGETVSGYVVQRSTGRAQIAELAQAYAFDAVESSGLIRFVLRGGASAVTIADDDLVVTGSADARSEPVAPTRADDLELPVEVAVQYYDTAAHYQIGAQVAQRMVPESESRISQNFAIAMSATQAKGIADRLLYDAWSSRTRYEFSTSWQHLKYEPTDVVTLQVGARSLRMRLVDEDTTGGLSRRVAVADDASVFSQAPIGVSLPAVSDNVSLAPPTRLVLLDIPLLRDTDDGVGFYAAACGLGDGWTGAQTYKSADGGATWASYGPGLINEAAIGAAGDVLGDFTRTIFDETNSVTVKLSAGELASITELAVLNGGNVAMLGDEIIQFRDATLTDTDTYVLTGLLRGRRGTEWATATHAAGERFVLLSDTTTYLMTAPSAEYDLARSYRGASFGEFIDDALTQSFTNTAVSLIPYAPVQLGGGRDASGNITLNWTRRSRINAGWNNYADAPLGEASEAYKVRIYTTSGYTTVARTISGLTASTTTYTAAEQVTDFGSTQATIYWDVCQISATVGDGYFQRGTT